MSNKDFNMRTYIDIVNEGNIHDDMALMKKQHDASVAAGNDPRLQVRRGERLMKQQYKTNRGVDMPADQVARMQSSREVFDMDYDDKFGKYDWDKPVEFDKPTDAQLAKHNEIMANRKQREKKYALTPAQRETYKQSRNAQTARYNNERVANGLKPFPMEEDATANVGSTSLRTDGKDIYAKGKIGSANVSADSKGNAYAKGKIAGGTMATAVNRSGEGGASFTDNKGRTVSHTTGTRDAWVSPGPNQISKRVPLNRRTI